MTEGRGERCWSYALAASPGYGSGSFSSLFADWALPAKLLLWVYRLTHSGVGTSLVGLAGALPLLALSPVAEALVDCWHRGHMMATAVLTRAALLLPLLLVTMRAQLPLIVLVTLLVNGASQFFGPAAAWPGTTTTSCAGRCFPTGAHFLPMRWRRRCAWP